MSHVRNYTKNAGYWNTAKYAVIGGAIGNVPGALIGGYYGYKLDQKKNMTYGNRRINRSRFTRKSRPAYRRTFYRAKPKVKVYRRRFTRTRTFRRRR